VHISDSLRVAAESRKESSFPLSSPAILFSNHAAPCCQALAGCCLSARLLRRPYQAGLHRDVSEVRGGDGLLGQSAGDERLQGTASC
jgi:hypothetical protein